MADEKIPDPFARDDASDEVNYASRDKNVVIANGVRYTKADADRFDVKPDVRNKARTTRTS